MKRYLFILAIVGLCLGCSSGGGGGDPVIVEYDGELTGEQVIPPVTTDGSGQALFRYGGTPPTQIASAFEPTNGGHFSVEVQIDLAGIDGVTAVHLHRGGPEDPDGFLWLDLFNGSPTGPINGTFINEWFFNEDLHDGSTMTSVEGLMRGGCTYVDVHTVDFPEGELRAQIDDLGECFIQ